VSVTGVDVLGTCIRARARIGPRKTRSRSSSVMCDVLEAPGPNRAQVQSAGQAARICFTSPLRGCQFLTKKKRRAPSLEPVMANQTGGKSGPVQFRSSWTGALSQHLLLARIMHLRALFDREGMPHLFFGGGGGGSHKVASSLPRMGRQEAVRETKKPGVNHTESNDIAWWY